MKQQIGHKFTEAVNREDRSAYGVLTSRLRLSPLLYTHYLDQYEQALCLSLTLERVLSNEEHELVMEEAQRLGYKLPDETFIRWEMKIHREFLDSFDPYDIAITKDGRISLPIKTARAFHFMAEYNQAFSIHILRSVFKSEYLRRFTDLKNAGVPYTGPSALQEAVNMLAVYEKTAREESRQRQIQRNWPHFSL